MKKFHCKRSADVNFAFAMQFTMHVPFHFILIPCNNVADILGNSFIYTLGLRHRDMILRENWTPYEYDLRSNVLICGTFSESKAQIRAAWPLYIYLNIYVYLYLVLYAWWKILLSNLEHSRNKISNQYEQWNRMCWHSLVHGDVTCVACWKFILWKNSACTHLSPDVRRNVRNPFLEMDKKMWRSKWRT